MSGGETLVATYNIHGGVGLDGRYDPHRIVKVLHEIDADVVGLQEVDSRSTPGRTVDQFELIAEAGGYSAVPGPNLVHGRGRYGNLLLSRWPLASRRRLDISVAPFEARGAIDAVLEREACRLRIVVTHLGLRRRERRQQLEAIRTVIDGDATPLVLLGDLNIATGFELRRSWLNAPPGLFKAPRTYPANLPLLALDRIWTRPAELLRAVWTHRSALSRVASDHLPVVARIAVMP